MASATHVHPIDMELAVNCFHVAILGLYCNILKGKLYLLCVVICIHVL